MNTQSAKKLVVGVLVMALVVGFQVAFADGSANHSPYHTPADTGVNLDFTLVIGSVLYGAGVLLTSSSKAILAKISTRLG